MNDRAFLLANAATLVRLLVIAVYQFAEEK
jgi:hypothetical protein